MDPSKVLPNIPQPQNDAQYVLFAILAAGLIAWGLWLMVGKKRKWNGTTERRTGEQCMNHALAIEKLNVESSERNAELGEFKTEVIAFKNDVNRKFEEQQKWLEKRFDALNTTLIEILRDRK